MKLEDLLTTYWAQTTLIITLLIGVIGYFIKRFFDTKSKKIEINHTLYQQNRLTTVNRFFESYADAEKLWNEISIYKVVTKEYSTVDMDSLTRPILNELDRSLFELMIYFENDEYKKFEKLVSNIKSIHNKVRDLYFDYESKMTETNKANSFDSVKNKAYKENKEIICELSKAMKEIFNN